MKKKNTTKKREEEEKEKPTARVINFDHLSKSVWHTLNTSWYTQLSSSKQYEASLDAYNDVTKCIESIRKKTPPTTSAYGTKLSALETLRKIAKTVLLSNGDTPRL
ncbi:hypothetical protein B0H66DRAFT_563204 [Apodospora peruviana]|uniref:Uncharacterized protein n=1 Tax=Apodospora peruviana TaxID=516989 RepID=A0AAE0HXA8_9PEZI|nr:hypothetical protein B0H66DRAFT_563204 [Apodospora peruviana]